MPIDNARVALLLGAIGVVYLGAFGFALHAIARRTPLGRRGRWARRIVVGLAVLGVACFVYARFVEPYRLEVTHVRVATAKLKHGAKPIRIVQISDVHSDPAVRLEERLPAAIAAEHPDAIVFTGDAINSRDGLSNFRRLMTGLSGIAPTYAVRGNWDVWYWGDIDLFGGTGVIELNDTVQPLTGSELWLAGLPYGDEAKLEHVIATIPPGAISVLLFHTPDEIEHASTLGIDLYLAGHTHGGQFALPWYGALITYSKFDKRFEAGRYQVGSTTLYVNRGIGMEGGHAPRIRFFARPEVTVIDLVATD
jgi:predicted MPP superfamily phosphohydrolase